MTIYEPFDHHRVSRAMAGQAIGHHIIFHGEVGSTNDTVAELARTGHAEGTVVFAEAQSKGRGRRGASWVSPPGTNLLFSVLLRPTASPVLWPRLTHLCALAVCQTIRDLCPSVPTEIKWPNDIYIGGRKAAGILVEAAQATQPDAGDAHAVLGVGLNVNMRQDEFPDDLPDATSLFAASDGSHRLSRESIAIQILRALDRLYPSHLLDPQFSTVIDAIRRMSHLLGREITAEVDGGRFHGRACDLGPNGELIVEVTSSTGTTSTTVLTSADSVRPQTFIQYPMPSSNSGSDMNLKPPKNPNL